MSDPIAPDDLCWCGSGRQYKDCHLLRGEQKPLPVKAIAAAMNEAKRYETCLHPDASPHTCSKVIAAHTLQRARILREIINSQNHVQTFFSFQRDEKKDQLNIIKRGWKEASTFTAFCSTHDSILFAPLETRPFVGTKEQIFLIAYRAICWELYQKITALKMLPEARDRIDYGRSIEEQFVAQAVLQDFEKGLQAGLDDFQDAKRLVDTVLKTGDYSQIATYEIVMTGPLTIASTGAINPDWSLRGEQLQTITDLTAKTEWLAFGIDIADNNNLSIVFLWLEAAAAPQKYMQSVDLLDERKLAEFLVQFIFTYCENTYFSETWWNSLSYDDQTFLSDLMNLPSGYGSEPKYDFNRSIAPWKVIGRKWS